jgi:hypothetical protein
VYPLVDDATGIDTSGTFTVPTSLITDMYLCVPNIPAVDVEKFYVQYIIARNATIEVGIGYDDPATPNPLGAFRGIVVSAAAQSTYLFTPSKNTVVGDLAALYLITGQITIGLAEETSKLLGRWQFDPSSTYISPTRIARGLINLQYIKIGDRIFSGTVKLREGNNVRLDVATSGDTTNVTINIDTPTAGTILNDNDVITALTNAVGVPIRAINGILADINRDFAILGDDCTSIEPVASGVTVGNPCATPCCPEDANLDAITQSIENLNLKYAALTRFYELNRDLLNDLQNKLASLGNTL